MKRSEIIDIIINEICNHEPISRKNKNIEFASEWILKKIEEAGMLPPEAVFEATGIGCLCTMRESCSSCGGYANEWEKE